MTNEEAKVVEEETIEKCEGEIVGEKVGLFTKISNGCKELKAKKAEAIANHPALKVVDVTVKVGAAVGLALIGAKVLMNKSGSSDDTIALDLSEDSISEVINDISEVVE